MSAWFRYFKCGNGLNPATLDINGTMFVICANVPPPEQLRSTLSDGEIAAAVLGSIVGAMLLVLLIAKLRQRIALQKFKQSIEMQQKVQTLHHIADTVNSYGSTASSSNVLPLTPEELARMKV